MKVSCNGNVQTEVDQKKKKTFMQRIFQQKAVYL